MVRWSFPNHHVSRSPPVPHTTLLEIPPAEQAQMLAALRRARYGYLLALHVLLLCATGRTPTEIAAVLFCSRSSVYRIVRLYHAAQLGITSTRMASSPAVRTTVLMPWIKRTVDALLKASPQAFGWCRTRWSCATLACELQAKHRLEVSAGTVRRWLHEWVGCGNGPSWSPKITIRSGSNAWPGFGGRSSTCKRMKWLSLLMNSISICCPKSVPRGCREGVRRKL